MANDQCDLEVPDSQRRNLFILQNVENPMKKKESEELEQIERHFEDEEIYFKQVNLFSYHMDCFSDQEINKTPA